MRLLYTSDIHASRSHLASLERLVEELQPDALVIGGDLVPHHLPGEDRQGLVAAQAEYLTGRFLPAMKRLAHEVPHLRIFLDMGNDDLAANRRLLAGNTGECFHLLHMQHHRLSADLDIIGYMNVPPTPFQRKDWEKPDSRQAPHPPGAAVRLEGYVSHRGHLEERRLDLHASDTIEQDLKQMGEAITRPFVLVAHCPPAGTDLDVLHDGNHVGSRAIRTFIETWGGKDLLRLSLHGHIHEAPMVSGRVHTPIAGVPCLNAGQTGGEPADLRSLLIRLTADGGIDWEAIT